MKKRLFREFSRKGYRDPKVEGREKGNVWRVYMWAFFSASRSFAAKVILFHTRTVRTLAPRDGDSWRFFPFGGDMVCGFQCKRFGVR